MQVIRGQEDQEMKKGIELLSNQEVKMMILDDGCDEND